ncbi:hypothetical protein V8F06_010763 [Rhypophila decipiens]
MSLSQISSLPPAQQEAILNGPALGPPPGVLPNLTDPPNRNQFASAVTIICLVAATFSVLLRVVLQVFVMKKVRITDALLVVGYANFLAFVYCVYRIIHGTGFFVHQWNVRVKDIAEFGYVIHMGSNLYGGVMLSIKSAVLLEWMHIFVPRGWRNGFFWCCVAILTVNVIFYIAGIVIESLSCIPYAAIWDKTIPGAKCLNRKALDLTSSILNLVIDLAILILPHRVIWQLHLSVTKKFGISVLFIIGVFACGAAAVRIAVTWTYCQSDDITYTVSAVSLWGLAEVTAVFLVLCIPHWPKVMKEIGVTSWLTSSVKSLIGITSSNKSATVAVDNAWSANGPAVAVSKVTAGGGTNMEMTAFDSRRDLNDSNVELQGSNGGIVQTIELSTKSSTENSVTPWDVEDSFYRQHPWAERKSNVPM